jgi:glycogen synthase
MEAIDGVIAARKDGTPVRLIVAGAPHAEDRDYCRQCVDRAREAPDAIELRLGYIADDELPALFDRIDALVMPYNEFFSQSGVALLAASNGRPIVAAPAGGIGALMAEGMPGEPIETPITGATVAAAVKRFLAIDADTWRERAEQYRQLTLDRRAWPTIGRNYLDLAISLGLSPRPDRDE